MRKFINIFIFVFAVVNFSGAPVFSSKMDPLISDEETITGILVKVDIKKQALYVRENSRIVKFKASHEICEKFKNKTYSSVSIKYRIGGNKVLQIISISLSEKKNESLKSNTAEKRVKKKGVSRAKTRN